MGICLFELFFKTQFQRNFFLWNKMSTSATIDSRLTRRRYDRIKSMSFCACKTSIKGTRSLCCSWLWQENILNGKLEQSLNYRSALPHHVSLPKGRASLAPFGHVLAGRDREIAAGVQCALQCCFKGCLRDFSNTTSAWKLKQQPEIVQRK